MNREQEQQIVSSTLKKLNALSEETCTELTATTKRRKLTERDHSIKTRLAKAKEQSKQPTVTEGKKHRSTYSLMRQDEVSKTYSFPKSYVSYRKPRAVSIEQRERARQMMIERNRVKEV